MKSPFPGLDPYLERTWGDVCHSLTVYASGELNKQIRPGLLSRIDEIELVENGYAEPAYEGYIQILEPRPGRRPVTIIKFLTLWDKTSEAGISQYRRTVGEAIEAKASIVEIDLLRSGDWVLQVPESSVDPRFRQPYRICVRRAWDAGRVEFYPLPLQQRLPKLAIPLRQTDADAVLDLQELVDRCYFNGAYDSTDYSVPPTPPLDPATAEWAKALIAKRKSQ